MPVHEGHVAEQNFKKHVLNFFLQGKLLPMRRILQTSENLINIFNLEIFYTIKCGHPTYADNVNEYSSNLKAIGPPAAAANIQIYITRKTGGSTSFFLSFFLCNTSLSTQFNSLAHERTHHPHKRDISSIV